MKGIASETLWNALPVPGFAVDATGRILEANNAAELFMNTSARSLKGRHLQQVLSDDAALELALQRAGGDSGPIFVRNIKLFGGAAAGEATAEATLQIAPLPGAGAQLLLLVQRRGLAQHLGRTDQARQAARSAIGMAEMLAHEIKNPLAGITGAAQLLAMSLSREDRELCDLIVGESRRIVALLDQVEQFGDLRPPQRLPENIHDLLDRAQKSAEVGFGRHMRFTLEYDPSLPLTYVDANQMLQVFSNLLRNAAEAADMRGETGHIKLRTFYDHALSRRTSGGGGDGTGTRLPLQVEIIDDGPGIPADLVQQVFEPFVSGRENGTGLGLALVSKIIADHESWISLESVPGRTIFRLSLPVAPQPPKIAKDES